MRDPLWSRALPTGLVVSLLLSACGVQGEFTVEDELEDRIVAELTPAQRQSRAREIRDHAASFGLTNSLPLAGIADAETHMAHCWSEARWACQGPASADCGGGPVIAGAGDGPCYLRQGGLGLFQFDAGTYDDTLAREGRRILTVEGSVEAAIDFVADMVRRSVYVSGVHDRASALAWIEDVRVDGPTWDAWLKTVTHYYNGCVPGRCSVHAQRYFEYDNHARGLLNELGETFWYSASSTPPTGTPPSEREWRLPMSSTTWRIGFNRANPWLSGTSGCFGTAMSQLIHAGEDWASHRGSEVVAVGEGEVVFAGFANYPGYVVVIEHTLTPSEQAAIGRSTPLLYSQYGHLGAPAVGVGDRVVAGQRLGGLLDQGSNTHLHWEMRSDDRPPLCGNTYWGPGYTGPGTDARTFGYLAPEATVLALASAGGATTCDNGVGIDETACAFDGDHVEYVCKRPHDDASGQWDARTCPAGTTCIGQACAADPAASCESFTTADACDAASGDCAWYFCADLCRPAGTPIESVCPPESGAGPATPVPTSPSPDASVGGASVSFTWQSAAGATRYELELLHWDGAIWAPYYVWTQIAGTHKEVWPVYVGRHFAWRVRACDATTCSDPSEWRVFHFAG